MLYASPPHNTIRSIALLSLVHPLPCCFADLFAPDAHASPPLCSARAQIMSTAVNRKRPAADQDPRVGGGKKPRYSFGSICDYEKQEVLGEGAYGLVLKGRDRRTGKKVALKWLRGYDLRTITREAGCLAACRGHPSIIEILDVATDAETGDFFLVTELVAGGQTLREEIYRPLDEDVARRMMGLLIDAAKKIHGAGIVHRDIKPENVLVTMFGGFKVCDFGSATRQKPAGVPYEECRVGTLIYTSPEQLTGNKYYSQAVDMWALGCIMAELLAGETLFIGETEEDMLAEMSKLRDQISSTGKIDLEFFDEISEAGREVLIGLLAFNPDERLTAAEALTGGSSSPLIPPERSTLALCLCSVVDRCSGIGHCE